MMSHRKYSRTILFGIMLANLTLFGCVLGDGMQSFLETGTDLPVEDADLPIPQDAPLRDNAIPSNAVKALPESDLAPPILHSDEWENPVPLPGEVNTAGAEDSPFISPDGNTMYFFFTPDLSVPHEKQVLDGVTGIYSAHFQDDEWVDVRRIVMQMPGKLAMDGCPFVQGSVIWFCSAREGYTGLHLFTAKIQGGEISGVRIVDDQIDSDYEVGELHITSDQKELYFHSARPGGKGQYDIWVTRQENGEWQYPENVEIVNSPETDGWPFVSQDHSELWFTRTHQGSPAIFRSLWSGNSWSEPELIVSQLAGEATLDDQGNLFFVHHYLSPDGPMQEADIYVAYRR